MSQKKPSPYFMPPPPEQKTSTVFFDFMSGHVKSPRAVSDRFVISGSDPGGGGGHHVIQ